MLNGANKDAVAFGGRTSCKPEQRKIVGFRSPRCEYHLIWVGTYKRGDALNSVGGLPPRT